MTKQLNIGIIGGGIAGLSAAWDLVRAGHRVTVYEAGERVGGLAAGFKDDNWDWELEKFYHHWFESDSDILKLAEELGVRNKVFFPRPKTSFWIDGELVRSEIDPLSVLQLPLSRMGLLRFAAGGAFVKLTPRWQPLESETAADWMQRYMGKEGYERFFKPLLIGKFGDYYDQVNMAWLWARVKARSLRLGTFEGGFQAFLDTLAGALLLKGAKIRTKTPVEKINTNDEGKPTLVVNGETITCDYVISTTSPKIMLKLTPRLQETPYGKLMGDLTSIGGLVVVAALKQRLMHDGTYWLNLPADTPDKAHNHFPYLALVEHTNYVDKKHYGGDHIVYMGDYAPADHEYFQMSEEELYNRFIPTLHKVNPNFHTDWVRKWWVFRAPYAQPVPFVNHSQNIPDLKTPVPNVLWASMSQIYPWDRGTNFSVEIGRRAAGLVLGTETDGRAVKR